MVIKPYQTNRNQAQIRHHRKRIVQRKKKKKKKRIASHQGWSYKYNGYLAKGKIHCSCWWCCHKTYRLGYPKSEQARVKASSNNHVRQLEDISIIQDYDNPQEAWSGYKKLHKLHPTRELYVFHTSRSDVEVVEEFFSGVPK